MFGGGTGGTADVALAVAGVVVHMFGGGTGGTADVALAVAGVLIHVIGRGAGGTADVALAVAGVVIHVLLRLDHTQNVLTGRTVSGGAGDDQAILAGGQRNDPDTSRNGSTGTNGLGVHRDLTQDLSRFNSVGIDPLVQGL